MTATASKPDPTTDYANKVTAGKVVTGRLVRLACARHLRDLKDGSIRGLRWDVDAANRAIRFFGFLRLESPDGPVPFKLQPFQEFKVGSLFGWMGPDGFRRFRTAYVEEGKGSGKTPLASGLGLFALVADDEPEPEVYCCAVTYKQASIAFRDAQNMADRSPHLKKLLDVGKHNIAFPRRAGFMRPVSSEKRGLDGPRPHFAIVDEIHEHQTPIVVDKIRAGTKARRQALILEITNSGYDRTSVCWDHHVYSVKVLEGVLEDDTWFAYVCQLDPCAACQAQGKTTPSDGCPDCDDWREPASWSKANPGLDTILPSKYLKEQVHEAMGRPAKEGIVKRLNFCIWTEGAVHAIPMDRWDACKRPVDRPTLVGRECYAGLDIGATSDFTALALLFPEDDADWVEVDDPKQPDGPKQKLFRRSYTLLPHFWLPERSARRDSRMEEVIALWKRQGLVKETPGDVVDYDLVLEDIIALADLYGLREIAIDRGFQGAQMATNLMKTFGELVVAFPQGILSMNAPFREFIELVVLGRMHHDGDPVLRWMVSNCAAETRGGLIKPSKDHSAEKIDIVTAATMGLARAMLNVSVPLAVEVW